MSKEITLFEALEILWNAKQVCSDSCSSMCNHCQKNRARKIIETALKDYEKKTKLTKEYKDVDNVTKRLRALDIIIEKRVDVDYLISCIEQDISSLLFYNQYCEENHCPILTQKEYDLLKEVLKNDWKAIELFIWFNRRTL